MADTPVRENQLDSGFEEYVTENKTIDQFIDSNKTSSISPDDLKSIIAKVEMIMVNLLRITKDDILLSIPTILFY